MNSSPSWLTGSRKFDYIEIYREGGVCSLEEWIAFVERSPKLRLRYTDDDLNHLTNPDKKRRFLGIALWTDADRNEDLSWEAEGRANSCSVLEAWTASRPFARYMLDEIGPAFRAKVRLMSYASTEPDLYCEPLTHEFLNTHPLAFYPSPTLLARMAKRIRALFKKAR